jgi:hypothetical protein
LPEKNNVDEGQKRLRRLPGISLFLAKGPCGDDIKISVAVRSSKVPAGAMGTPPREVMKERDSRVGIMVY